MSNPPFTRDPKAPPFHLRALTANEFATWRRLIAKQEASRYCGPAGNRDSVHTPVREHAEA